MKLFFVLCYSILIIACNNNVTPIKELTLEAIDSASQQAAQDSSNTDAIAIIANNNLFKYIANGDTVKSITGELTATTTPVAGFTIESKKNNGRQLQLVINTTAEGRYSFSNSDTATVQGFFLPSPKNKKDVYRFLTGTVTLLKYNSKGVYYLRFEGVAANTRKNKIMITDGVIIYNSNTN
jgi:hypothetical protein